MCSWAVSPAPNPPTSSSSERVSAASTPQPSPSAWAHRSPSSTSTSPSCAPSTLGSAAASPPRYSTSLVLAEAVKQADLVIGAVLVPGAKAPVLVPNSLVAQMKSGSVLVDIAIDQGRLLRGFTPHHPRRSDLHRARQRVLLRRQHADTVARTSTQALTGATLPYVLQLADKGWEQALSENAALAGGLSTHAGSCSTPRSVRHSTSPPSTTRSAPTDHNLHRETAGPEISSGPAVAHAHHRSTVVAAAFPSLNRRSVRSPRPSRPIRSTDDARVP